MTQAHDPKLLFDELGLSPLASESEIAERLRELMTDADEPRRAFLRGAFDQLTRSPRVRFELAMGTFLEEPVAELPPLPMAALPDHGALRASIGEAAHGGPGGLEAALTADDDRARAAAGPTGSGYVPLLEDPVVTLVEEPFLVRYLKRRPS